MLLAIADNPCAANRSFTGGRAHSEVYHVALTVGIKVAKPRVFVTRSIENSLSKFFSVRAAQSK